jgi:hypothetical protein
MDFCIIPRIARRHIADSHISIGRFPASTTARLIFGNSSVNMPHDGLRSRSSGHRPGATIGSQLFLDLLIGIGHNFLSTATQNGPRGYRSGYERYDRNRSLEDDGTGSHGWANLQRD